MAEPLVAPQLQDDHQLLVSATREAGAIALGYFNGSVKSWDKKPDDPVSEADLEIDRLLKGKLLGAGPDYGWLSEETEDDSSRLRCKRTWVVDPIDGTRGFPARPSLLSVQRSSKMACPLPVLFLTRRQTNFSRRQRAVAPA